MRTAVLRLKYRNHRRLAAPLGQMMATAWRQQQGTSGADSLVPVPLYAGRLEERGFNQATLLAREIARILGLPVDAAGLARVRATEPQFSLHPGERHQNVHGAFACNANLAGRRMILVDDVCTTGATLEACAHVLKSAGAADVWALTAAHAGADAGGHEIG